MNKMRCLISIFICIFLFFCLTSEAECKNIILKVMAVNPSKYKTQTVNLKAYLPQEATPEDVIDAGDLEIEYDVSRGIYYAYKKVQLAPGESITRSIEMNDIWLISQGELTALRSKAKPLIEGLKNTPYYEGGMILVRDIELKSNDILTKQAAAMDAVPQAHIAAYRKNFATLNAIKTNIESLEKLIFLSKTGSGVVVERVSVKATWWLILAVIVSLGLLSVIFFIIWNRQARQTKQFEESGLEE